MYNDSSFYLEIAYLPNSQAKLEAGKKHKAIKTVSSK